MKNLSDITEDEVKHICELVGEPYLSYMTNNDGKWDKLGLEIQINTTSTMNQSINDSYITIRKNGMVQLWRNNGDWGGHRYDDINGLIVTDYLRERGYEFKY
jgi:hypothetical protein